MGSVASAGRSMHAQKMPQPQSMQKKSSTTITKWNMYCIVKFIRELFLGRRGEAHTWIFPCHDSTQPIVPAKKKFGLELACLVVVVVGRYQTIDIKTTCHVSPGPLHPLK